MRLRVENIDGSEYPKTLDLKDNRQVLVRPLKEGDEDLLLTFYRKLPPEARLRLRQDNTNRKILKRFLEEINFGSLILLGAFEPDNDSQTLIGEVSLRVLHHGWSRHVGEIRYCLQPEIAPSDLGAMLIREMLEMGAAQGLDKLVYRVLDDQIRLKAVLQNLGFEEEAILRDHATDLSGKKHDVHIMSNYMAELWRKMEDLILSQEFPPMH